MKYFIITFLLIFSSINSYSQGLFEKLKEKTEEKIEEKIEESIEGKENQKTPEKNEEKKQQNTNNETISPKEEIKVYSKFDFVPGDTVIFFEDFSQDNIGDFPKQWNTNGTGEVVTLDKYPGKWLKMKGGSLYVPEGLKTLPENFTVEFDLITDESVEGSAGEYNFGFIAGDDNKYYMMHPYKFTTGTSTALFDVAPRNSNKTSYNFSYESPNSNPINSSVDDDIYMGKFGKIVRFSICVNSTRIRLYVDQKKVIDLPRGLIKDNYNVFKMGLWYFNNDKDNLYLALMSNLRIAVGKVDARSKLISEGKLVTHGITFDVASDKIKALSYGTLKEIAQVLKDNPNLKVKIVGHTDSDGSAETNLDLSVKRAVSVKNFLVSEFGIQDSRLETDGKGASEPVSPNDTPDGKANNRRVEFIKL